jgi:hypothetical protein
LAGYAIKNILKMEGDKRKKCLFVTTIFLRKAFNRRSLEGDDTYIWDTYYTRGNFSGMGSSGDTPPK